MCSRLIYSNDSQSTDNTPITAYAVRIQGEPGWQVDGARLPLAEIRRWFEKSRRDVLEIRQIGDPFEGYDPPSWARSLAREEGWWRDQLSQCWRAPDEFIAKPYLEPREVEALAAAMSPPE